MKDKIKSFFSKIKNTSPKERTEKLNQTFKKIFFWTFLNPVVMIILGFLIGARMYELGYTNNLQGATVMITGSCNLPLMENQTKVLAEDEVKVASMKDGIISGVIRKTRESVVCKFAEISIDKLPLTYKLSDGPSKVPDIAPSVQVVEVKRVPTFKELEKRTVLATGVCKQQDGKELKPFVDERIAVTSVEPSADNPERFILLGVRKSDNIALACESRSITYKIVSDTDPIHIDTEPKEPNTFVGRTIVVSGTCYPYSTETASSQGKKVRFYRLVNSPVEVAQEYLEDGKLRKFSGTLVDRRQRETYGHTIACDYSKIPFTFKLDEEGSERAYAPGTESDAKSAQPLPPVLEEPANVPVPNSIPAPAGDTSDDRIRELNQILEGTK